MKLFPKISDTIKMVSSIKWVRDRCHIKSILFGFHSGGESDGACPSSEWKIHGDSCYLFKAESSDFMPWSEAEDTCLKYKSYLVSIHSTEENDFIVESMVASHPLRFNIGLQKINDGECF